MDFTPSPLATQVAAEIEHFFGHDILPRHRAWMAATLAGEDTGPIVEPLRAKARSLGLWNLGLPDLAADEPGRRLSNLDYAPVAEILGRLPWAPEVFNC